MQGWRCSHATWLIPGTLWTRGRTNIVGISLFGEVALPSELYELHICAICREVTRQWLFAKIVSLPLVLETALFSHYSKFMTMGVDIAVGAGKSLGVRRIFSSFIENQLLSAIHCDRICIFFQLL